MTEKNDKTARDLPSPDSGSEERKKERENRPHDQMPTSEASSGTAAKRRRNKGGPIYPTIGMEIPLEDAAGNPLGTLKKETTFPVSMDEPVESGDEKGEGNTEAYAAEVTDPNNPLYHEHILAWYVKSQIQASPLTPAEIAEKAGVSTSQIYRFLKGERSLTLESADRLLPVVGRSLVEKIRGYQRAEPSVPVGVEDRIEDEKERLRQRLEKWEKPAFDEAREIMKDLASLADRMRAMIDEL